MVLYSPFREKQYIVIWEIRIFVSWKSTLWRSHNTLVQIKDQPFQLEAYVAFLFWHFTEFHLSCIALGSFPLTGILLEEYDTALD